MNWQAERSEDFLAAAHGRDVVSRAELALDADGKVLALRVRSLANVGAYATATGVVIQLLIGPWVSTSIYDIQTIDLHFIAVLTNTAPTGAYRGAGRPEAIYLIERLFDAAARELELDPAELRRRNMIRPEQMPYTNAMGQVYDSGHFEQILDQGLALADWDGFAARRAAAEQRGRLRGRGIATFLEWTGGNVFEERVAVEVAADGFIEIYSATQAMGQGIATSYAQLAVDVFGVPIERIRDLQGDTDRGQRLRQRRLALAVHRRRGGAGRRRAHGRRARRSSPADALEAAPADIEYAAGRFSVAGTDLGIGLFELAGAPARARASRSTRPARSAARAGRTAATSARSRSTRRPGTSRSSPTPRSTTSAASSARRSSRGQIDGGAVQGIGQALCEQVVYDPESGQLLTAQLHGLRDAARRRRRRTSRPSSTPRSRA